MSKILLVIFSIQPILFCLVFGLTLINGYKFTEALSYFCVVVAMIHYAIIGLRELFGSFQQK